ncbi:ABC transporter permease subunit [Fodinicola acaciae]|uniref:ABC transporter permease subunit n=1 Tax=Fodinicola acaciae TaxID=2681555 RepID=UPI001C9E61BF|nr:ABC transporter permease subunit [Fodinicola acaciae]
MNLTVVSLTARVLLGRRRGLFLLILPVILVLLAAGVRAVAGVNAEVATTFLATFAIGTVVPLLGLIIGTGVIGPEIDDGSIVYLLAKPVRRSTIVVSKLAVAVGCVVVFAEIPVFVAGLILAGTHGGLAVGYSIGALLAGIAYCALFLLLAILTKHAVVVGLLYALIWESLVGNFISGAQVLSIQRWALSVTDLVTGSGGPSVVAPAAGIPLLVVAVVATTWYAGQRLRSLTLNESE